MLSVWLYVKCTFMIGVLTSVKFNRNFINWHLGKETEHTASYKEYRDEMIQKATMHMVAKGVMYGQR